MYEIIIKETKTVKAIKGNEWAVIGESDVPFKNESSEKTLSLRSDGKYSVYGYTPEVEKQIVQTVDIFNQKVEKLDITKVIRAINDL